MEGECPWFSVHERVCSRGRRGGGTFEVWRSSSLKGLKFGGGRSVEGAPRQKKGCGRKRKDECVRVRQLGADCGEDGR